MKVIAENRKARHLYQIIDTLEAGIELKGTEVKSLRNHLVNMTDAFCRGKDGELWLMNLHISPYVFGNLYNHDPLRSRRLLLHKKEAVRWSSLSEQKGLTIVPLRLYFNDRGRAKVEIALVKPKKLYDRRQEIQDREQERELHRVQKYRE
ncbi:MAG TPA: SsrA-binding protein SmpB [Candidatus Atribacteria bacterium]|jgi:SsrA-binding protein|uniref:SsrA-binding protein n=1 Tax=Candidatus Atribacter allofermentans TaxID=1852833 RepID=A0A1V5SJP6_9BACT|nr:SsrA-binding protein SmpB [Clostridiales bacterium]OQA54554.1 MAG: SsrA-binding protein [Candidatus Atribacteria bacterium ADurb.Bin276]HHT10624.1 SsrA-binding protein SmpB [Candidatus Atribacteria bacterium]